MSDRGESQYIVGTDLMGVYNTTAAAPADWFVEALGAIRADSGVRVDAGTALGYAPWWQGVNIISGDVARMTLDLFSRDANDDREKQRKTGAYEILNRMANVHMSGYTLRETMQAHALAWGNGYAFIERQATRVTRLIPVHPRAMTVDLDDNGILRYTISITGGERVAFGPQDILHIHGLGDDGIRGYSVVALARNSIGLGLAEEKHGSSHFNNNAQPGVVLKHPAKLDKQVADTLLSQWEQRHQGSQNSARPALLTNGLELIQMAMSNEDSQWLEGRKFQRDDIASWFCLPPHKLGSDSRVSYNSLESEERSYVNQTLARWLERWESECDLKLLDVSQQNKFWYFEHNTGQLIQGDIKTQAEVATKLVASKIITRNEARKKFNLNSVEGGDEFENPNTTSGKSSNEPVEPEQNEADADSTVSAMRHLIIDRMEHLVCAEIKRLNNMSGNENVLAAIASMYDKLELTIASALDPCIGAYSAALPGMVHARTGEVAGRYVKESQDAIAGGLHGDYVAAISEITSGWLASRPASVISMIETRTGL